MPNKTVLASQVSPRLNIIRSIWAFVIVACMVLIMLDIWRSWNAYTVRIRESQAISSDLTRSIARHAEDIYTQADTVLVGVVERLEMEGTGPEHLNRLRTLMFSHVKELPQLHGLFIYDQDGRWLVNSRQVIPDKVRNSDREYFIHHRTQPDRGPYVGSPIRSRSTGDWILTVSRRFNRPDGSFGGVVLATIYMDYFSSYYKTFDIGKRGTIILTSHNGKLLVRRPLVEEHIGKDMKEAPLFRDHLPVAPVGTYMQNKSVLDGIERMTSYRRLERYPMLVAVSLSKEEILDAWWNNTWQNFIGVILLTALLGLMGSRLARHIDLHLKAEKKLLEAQEDLKKLNLYLERIAQQDGLTGLANRRHFDAMLLNEFNRAMRSQKPLALVLIDVDLFKQYNDIFGHPAGDECLKLISQTIRAFQKRPADLTARYGGEEIAVLLPETELEGARMIAESIRLSVCNLALDLPDSPYGIVTVSCGVAVLVPEKDVSTPMDLVIAADRALYRAKSMGRNRIICAPGVAFA